ncbi:MAG: threonylcarbamoyl-AMP synthase [Muribaculaceae bacterium]|nr:threonylcarbamoyl-AMP synthase [Muribaculaceae bacterium]
MVNDLRKAAEVVEGGGIILYPTDTIWGIGCDSTNEEAIERIFAIKRRPDSKAMISLCDSSETLRRFVETVHPAAEEEMARSERPVTIIYERPKRISEKLKAGDGSAAFRIPRNPFTQELCALLGKPLVSTSANFSGETAPTTFSEISEEIKKAVDYVCTSGRDTIGAAASRIVKISDKGEKTIIRE